MDLEGMEREMARLDDRAVVDDDEGLTSVELWGKRHDAGLRRRAEGRRLMSTVLVHYANADDATREQVRVLLARYRTFTWWSAPESDLAEPESWRLELLLISARDKFSDRRDTIVMIDELTKAAIEAGIDIGPMLDEVAALSCDDDVWPSSTRRAMLGARKRVPKR